jgi:hypothetical protein
MFISGSYYSGDPGVKPHPWGNVSDVQSGLFHNAEKMGINPADIVKAMPLWEEGGTTAHDYGISGSNGELSNAIFTGDGVSFGVNQSRMVVSTSKINHALGTVLILFQLNNDYSSSLSNYFFDSNGQRFLFYITSSGDTGVFTGGVGRGNASIPWQKNTMYSVALEYNKNELYRGGTLLNNYTDGDLGTFGDTLYFGDRQSGTNESFDGLFYSIFWFNSYLPISILESLEDNPWQLWQPRTPVFYSFDAAPPVGRPLPQRVLSGPFSGPLNGVF